MDMDEEHVLDEPHPEGLYDAFVKQEVKKKRRVDDDRPPKKEGTKGPMSKFVKK